MSNESVNRAIRLIAEQSIDKASQSLSKMLKAGAVIDLKRIDLVDISDVMADITGENQEVTGSFVDLRGDAPFKFLFYVQTQGAFLLTDLLLNKEPGTTGNYDEYVSGTIQEIGNILASAIANTFAGNFQMSFKPTPPVVFKDYAAVLLEEMIMQTASEDNKILLIESGLVVKKINLPCRIFIIPMPGSYKILEFSGGRAK